MNIILHRRLSLLLSLTTITVLGSGVSAKAETSVTPGTQASAKLSVASSKLIGTTLSTEDSQSMQETASSGLAPVPGTTVTSADVLAPRLVEPVSETSATKVAQTDSNTNPSPGGTETTPSPNSAPGLETPAPATPTTPEAPALGAPTTPENPAPAAPTTPENPAPAAPAPVSAVNLSDVDASYWAYPFIQGLAARNVIAGFPDGTFRPEQPVTRAQFAAMVQKAFAQKPPIRQLPPGGFTDVPADYWAAPAIQTAYETGFLSGYPNNTFLPNQQIPKVEAITSLASGLGLTPSGVAADIVNTSYADAAQLPAYAIAPVAAATQANVVVNYPDVRTLNPQVPSTRAEAAALLYQALVRLGQVEPIPTNVAAATYIVGGPGGVVTQTPPPTTTPSTPPTETPTTTAATATGIPDYLGAAVNIGVLGNTNLGDINFTVFSKIRLLRAFPVSLRPAVVIGGDPTVLVPITFDLPLGRAFRADVADRTFPLFPYIGGGVIIPTNSADVGPLVTAGFDYRLSPRFTATAGVNVGWVSGDPQLGVLLGVGYNFNLFGGF